MLGYILWVLFGAAYRMCPDTGFQEQDKGMKCPWSSYCFDLLWSPHKNLVGPRRQRGRYMRK